ncbi:MAG: murein biosynthesis integral membrane protein MurJ [Planctomycetes bacterium]|nr:murein biosynthesis integral membrane protein MurJ [Planctomycetota bacterium]
MEGDFVRHARTVSLLTLVSRVLGVLRDASLAFALGTSTPMEAFSVAFSIPNLLRRLFSEGALSAAFIPVFTSLNEQDDREAAQRLANLAITVLVALLAALVLVGEGVVLTWYAFGSPSPRLELTLGLTAVMLPFAIAICLIGLLQAILNVRGHFAMPAAAPIVLNVFIIAGAVLSAPVFGDSPHVRVYGVACCVLVAGLAMVAAHVPPLRRHGLRFRPAWDLASPHLRRVAVLMLPMVVGLGVVQLNVFMDRIIALGLSGTTTDDGRAITEFHLLGRTIAYPMKEGAAAVMYYAQRLYQLPMGVFVVAIGTAIFPALSRHAHHGDDRGLAETLNRGLRMAMFIALPCTVGLMLVAEPLVRLMFERGRFSPDDTPRVAALTCVYTAGLVAYAALHLVTRAFFALQETRLPVKLSAAAAGLNFVLNLVLVWRFGVEGLALSTVITAVGQVLVLVLLLRRRVGRLGLRRFVASMARTSVATVAMAAAAWGAMRAAAWTGWAEGSTRQAIVLVLAAVVAGAAVFALAAKVMRMSELSEVLSRGRTK